MAVMLEICVDDAAGVAAAVVGGADRIELCGALELGGLTPSPGLIEHAVATGVPVHAMIRPRAGSFVYDMDELALMAEDIRHALALGAAGVVVGALRPDDTLDSRALARFRMVSRDAALVLHRAIDLVPDPIAAVEEACALGFDKILSSGQEATALAGALTLARMVEAADGRLSVIAGSGLTPDNVVRIARVSGVHEVHASASQAGRPDPRSVAMGFSAGPRRRTSAALVRRLRTAIEESA